MARAKRDIPKITLKTPKLPKEPVPSNMNPTMNEVMMRIVLYQELEKGDHIV